MSVRDCEMAGHDIWMMSQKPEGPGAHHGPYCATCDQTWFFIVTPDAPTVERAKAWLVENRERFTAKEAPVEDDPQEGGEE